MTKDLKDVARNERNKYAREWRAKNKDKVKANNERYWLRKAEKAAKDREEVK